MAIPHNRPLFDDDLIHFRENVRRQIDRGMVQEIQESIASGTLTRSTWLKFGEAGFLCPGAPEEFGGLGLDFRFNCVVNEEMSYALPVTSLTVHSDMMVDYIAHYGSIAQKRAWLGRMVSGEGIVGVAMTEPGAGSDLQGIRTTAKRTANGYVINGSKTFISSGQTADLFIVATKTSSDRSGRSISLFLVDPTLDGFRRGRKLDKIGQDLTDTSELFFDGVEVPESCLLGNEGDGFAQLMAQLPKERLSLAIGAQAAAQRAFDVAVAFVKERSAFGRQVIDFQNTRFQLAEMKVRLQVGWSHIDHCLAEHIQGKLTAEAAAAAKLWHTEMQWQVVDACLQLHGGAGYMNEYEIARLWKDARVQRIYGGTSEIMKEVIGRDIARG